MVVSVGMNFNNIQVHPKRRILKIITKLDMIKFAHFVTPSATTILNSRNR